MKNMYIDETQSEYADFIKKIMAVMQNEENNSSEPIVVAEKIYEAATDGKNKLRYIAGIDAERIISTRKKLNDDDYMKMLKQQMGLD